MPRKRLTKADWSEIKRLYLSGEFKTDDELHAHIVKKMGKTISRQYLKNKISFDDWNSSRRAIEKKIEDTTIDLFAKNGMPKEEAVKICIEGMTGGRAMIEDLEEKLRNEENLKAADIVNFIQKLNTNMAIVRGFLQEYNKMTGCYAPAQMESSVMVSQDEEYHKAYEERLKKIEK